MRIYNVFYYLDNCGNVLSDTKFILGLFAVEYHIRKLHTFGVVPKQIDVSHLGHEKPNYTKSKPTAFAV